MWNHSTLSPEIRLNQTIIQRFKKYAKISGVVFIVLGLVGVLFPSILSLTTLAFVNYMMLFAGIVSGWMRWTEDKRDRTG